MAQAALLADVHVHLDPLVTLRLAMCRLGSSSDMLRRRMHAEAAFAAAAAHNGTAGAVGHMLES